MEQALAGLDADTHLHVSFDVDFLDPEIAPGVGTQVPGGPTYREAQLCMEMIADTRRLASLDVVELNPAFDVHNRTAVLAVDLIESLFGKSTLVRRPVWRSPSDSARRSARPPAGASPSQPPARGAQAFTCCMCTLKPGVQLPFDQELGRRRRRRRSPERCQRLR